MAQSIVGMLLPAAAQLRLDDVLLEAEYRLGPVQRCVPIVADHGGKTIGVVRYVEQAGDGQVFVAGLVDDRFELDWRKYFSLKIDRQSRAELLTGRKVRFTDAGLVEVALVESPRSWGNSEAQCSPVDFTVTGGGYAYGLSGPHKAVLTRATYWSQQHHRSADHVLVADPAVVYSTPVKRRRQSYDQVIAQVNAKMRGGSGTDALARSGADVGDPVPVRGTRHYRLNSGSVVTIS